MLVICVVVFAYNLVAKRLTAYSAQATVQAYIVSVAPEVAGNVVEIGVGDHQIVKEGDLLFRIDPQAYKASDSKRRPGRRPQPMWARENAASANRRVTLLAALSGAIPSIEAGRNLGGHIVYKEAGSPAR